MATGMFGANPEELRAHGGEHSAVADLLTSTEAQLTAEVHGVMWIGPDRERFVLDWDTSTAVQLSELAALEEATATTLEQQAQQQEECSQAGASGASGGHDGQGGDGSSRTHGRDGGSNGQPSGSTSNGAGEKEQRPSWNGWTFQGPSFMMDTRLTQRFQGNKYWLGKYGKGEGFDFSESTDMDSKYRVMWGIQARAVLAGLEKTYDLSDQVKLKVSPAIQAFGFAGVDARSNGKSGGLYAGVSGFAGAELPFKASYDGKWLDAYGRVRGTFGIGGEAVVGLKAEGGKVTFAPRALGSWGPGLGIDGSVTLDFNAIGTDVGQIHKPTGDAIIGVGNAVSDGVNFLTKTTDSLIPDWLEDDKSQEPGATP
ncbi:hypothetical protein JRG19_02070 [Pseudoclavibacter alba]|uniref:hypothetical protein n=1 Tax=Pseudoclavibacter albus TaxID=272241 RepID=UPI0019D23F41|nr:hypothetical protein [Pseudoclavibacter alba]MBN6777338.1 hypothetical protein [Pseudoclavibacter alba]